MINRDIKIGLLEYGYRIDKNSMATIEEIIEYAVEADKLGFSRFWLGEHHGPLTTTAFTNPDLLIGIIAGMTDQIKVGSAGSTIIIHDAYPVVTNYKLMNNMFYDRIDLGLAKGSGLVETKKVVKMDRDLNSRKSFRQDFDDKLKLIYDLLYNEKKNLEENEVVIPPYGGKAPEMWYLSTSYRNVETAIKYGLNYSRSLFHSLPGEDDYKKEELLKFKQDFFEKHKVYPKVNIGISICMKNTMPEALKALEQLKAHYGQGENEGFKIFAVTIDSLYNMLLEYQDLYGVDEFIIHDLTDDPQQLLSNINAISDRFNLQKETIVN
ncbi:LLM class flavin-dependent oxidoreductase [Psychroserpens luteolus]|uniref:LLM class flavin-dependent oxidoreductase n=1 Tax=Psychroserpens luteolus TaxID=2855840 RepID=UPI001E59C8B8|nr:LLM class flavin-dependent oxidoreductase [Psychroserpens luteolus]MCD2258060.1 LLM class flavin-dependent oxidoreductase [Psychroserpens luteolus]